MVVVSFSFVAKIGHFFLFRNFYVEFFIVKCRIFVLFGMIIAFL